MVIELAKPYDEEEAKRMMARAQYTPRPAPVAPPEKGMIQTVAETVGTSAMGKVGDAALFGGEAGKLLGMGETGLLAKGMAGAAKGATAAKAAGASMMSGLGAAAGPLGILGSLLAAKYIFRNEGGAVGPLSPRYKEEGGPALEDDPLFTEWSGLYDDMNSGIIEPSYPRLVELEAMLQRKYGNETQYKKHGGMTKLSGPLSNNKSVKMERKETIEYKN